MKTLFVGEMNDFIIHSFPKVLKEEDGKTPRFTDKKSESAEHGNCVTSITFYDHDQHSYDGRQKTARLIYVDSDDIIALADKIKLMKSETFIKKYDPSNEHDDLPF